jgi:hypothetical protein
MPGNHPPRPLHAFHPPHHPERLLYFPIGITKFQMPGPVQANLLFQTRLATTNQITAPSLKVRPGAIEFPRIQIGNTLRPQYSRLFSTLGLDYRRNRSSVVILIFTTIA